MNTKLNFGDPLQLIGKSIYFIDNILCQNCSKNVPGKECPDLEESDRCPQYVHEVEIETLAYTKYQDYFILTINDAYEFNQKEFLQEIFFDEAEARAAFLQKYTA